MKNENIVFINPLVDFFCFEQKGGEKFIDLVLLLPFIDDCFFVLKRGEDFCFVLVFTPLLMIDKKGEKDFEFDICIKDFEFDICIVMFLHILSVI